MKTKILFILCLLIGSLLYAQEERYECVSCSNNSINFNKYASGIGTDNTATGDRSFVGGLKSLARGNYSFAFGYNSIALGNNSISMGYKSNASNMYAVAIGRQSLASRPAAFALGLSVNAEAESAYVFGEAIKATASGTITIGIGAGSGENNLLNNEPYSIMMGVRSSVPTFFVEKSPDNGLTGRIGIGNVTAPLAKLHILGDDDANRPENASLYIQSAGNYYSILWLGDQHHFLKTKPDHAFEFNAGGNDFYFNEGNVGIGTYSHDEKLHVDGNIKATGLDASGNVSGADIIASGDLQAENMLATANITASQIKVTAEAGADFVFEEDYDLPEITDVEAFIRANKHLPNIPSARQMQEEGLDIGEMQIKLLQKIEELTLYVIDLKKENEEMRKEIKKLKNE